MMMNRKRSAAALALLLLLMTALPLSVSANSAVREWGGASGTGAVPVSGDCPLTVIRETLTVRVPGDAASAAPSNGSWDGGASVTAAYTFANPTDEEITASLAFPFGTSPTYPVNEQIGAPGGASPDDPAACGVTVDGAAVPCRLRGTLSWQRNRFDPAVDLPRLDEDRVFTADTPVTVCTFAVTGYGQPPASASLAFDWAGQEGTWLCFPAVSGFSLQPDGSVRVSAWLDRLSGSGSGRAEVTLYFIGTPPSRLPEWTLYETGAVEDGKTLPCRVTLTAQGTMTYRELALADYDPAFGVSERDWMNALTDRMMTDASNRADRGILGVPVLMPSELLLWYEYEITLPAHGTLTNTVTAPLYPDVDGLYTPAKYNFTYLLSPAALWADFGELEIVIDTPLSLLDVSPDGFEKTETGFRLTRQGLPEEELTFTLCASEHPEREHTAWEALGIGLVIFIALAALDGIALLVVLIVGITHIVRRKRRHARQAGKG